MFTQGKVKTVFQLDEPDKVLIQYEDKVTAGNGKKEAYVEDKGKICCLISELLFQELEKFGIETHYISMPTHRAMAVKKVDIIPIEVVVRNIAAGSIVRQTTLEEGAKLGTPLVEFYLKDDAKDDHWALRDHAAGIVARVCDKFGGKYPKLQLRIAKTYRKALSNPHTPWTTSYGVLIGLCNLGVRVIETVLLPRCEDFIKRLKDAMDGIFVPEEERKSKRRFQETDCRTHQT